MRSPYLRGVEQYFTVRAGMEAGISRGQLRGPRYERPFWGIRNPAGIESARARAFAPRMPERGFYMGTTAATLLGLPLPPRLRHDERLHIGVKAGARRVEAAGIARHHIHISGSDLTTTNELPVTSAARTFCDLGNLLRLAELVAVGDRILWRRDPLATSRELWEALDRYVSRRGVRTIRAAIPLLTSRADSAPESEIRVSIIEFGLPLPQVNRAVSDRRGRLIATPDLSWPRHRIALEYEGDHHRTDRDQWQHDLERFSSLQEAGWIVLRATAADLRDPRGLLQRLARLLTLPERP